MTRSARTLSIASLALLTAVPGVAQSQVADLVDGGVAVLAAPDDLVSVPTADPDAINLVPDSADQPSLVDTLPALEATGLNTAMTPRSGSVMLADLEPGLRANARIRLEPFGAPGSGQLVQAYRVEELWNSGRHTEAVSALESLEASGMDVAVAVSWRQPILSTQKLYYPDVRIGNRTNGVDAALDYDIETGNLFAMIVWDNGWSINLSTDGGESWAETEFWGGPWASVADMAVCGDYVWVGYSADGDDYHTARMRRFHTSDGTGDLPYDYVLISNENPNTIIEIVVAGNTPDKDNRIYVAYLVDETNAVRFWWDNLAGTSFGEIPTGIADADQGLDLTWNPFTVSDYPRWISYVSTGNDVNIYQGSGFIWNFEHSRDFTGGHKRTAISAYHDHVHCAFECAGEAGKTGICYLASDDAGASPWLLDDAYWPGASEVSGYAPDISVRSGLGRAIVFSSETGDIDDVYYTTCDGWGTASWSDPEWYNAYDHVSGADTYIHWMGTGCVSTYGMLYFDGYGDRVPFFDLMMPRVGGFFCDGFESGNTAAWAGTVP